VPVDGRVRIGNSAGPPAGCIHQRQLLGAPKPRSTCNKRDQREKHNGASLWPSVYQ
jgi:hypothetical protein